MRIQTTKNKYLFTAIILLCFIGCTKDTPPFSIPEENTSDKNGEFKLLGYGIDCTNNLLEGRSYSELPVLDINKAFNDKLIHTDNTTKSYSLLTSESTAGSYINSYNIDKKFANKFDLGVKQIAFTGSFEKNTSDQSVNSFSENFFYASYENILKIKQINFISSLNIEQIKKYLHHDFIQNIETKSAKELVEIYKTHIVVDLNIGGMIKLLYSGRLKEQENEILTKETISSAIGLSINSIGLNFETNKTKEELTKESNKLENKQSYCSFYGGTNDGRSITIESSGQNTETFDFSKWQESIDINNSAVVDINKAIPLYEFINNIDKKEEVKRIIEDLIKSKQIIGHNKTLLYRSDYPVLTKGQTIYSDKKTYALTISEKDGSLLIYKTQDKTKKSLFQFGTPNGSKLNFNKDGNLVLYDIYGNVLNESGIFNKNIELTQNANIYYHFDEYGNLKLMHNETLIGCSGRLDRPIPEENINGTFGIFYPNFGYKNSIGLYYALFTLVHVDKMGWTHYIGKSKENIIIEADLKEKDDRINIGFYDYES